MFQDKCIEGKKFFQPMKKFYHNSMRYREGTDDVCQQTIYKMKYDFETLISLIP